MTAITADELRKRAELASSFTRLSVLVDAFHNEQVVPAEWFAVLGEQWPMCDVVWTDNPTIRYLMTIFPRGILNHAMNTEERVEWERLPQMLTVYRGCYPARNLTGLSWSLSRDVAARFPFLTRYRAPGKPIMRTGRVNKNSVIYKKARGEEEIIAPRVRVIREDVLTRRDKLRAA